jgi:hypothetical protein
MMGVFCAAFGVVFSTTETTSFSWGSGEIKSRYVGQNKRIAPINIKPMSVF